MSRTRTEGKVLHLNRRTRSNLKIWARRGSLSSKRLSGINIAECQGHDSLWRRGGCGFRAKISGNFRRANGHSRNLSRTLSSFVNLSSFFHLSVREMSLSLGNRARIRFTTLPSIALALQMEIAIWKGSPMEEKLLQLVVITWFGDREFEIEIILNIREEIRCRRRRRR